MTFQCKNVPDRMLLRDARAAFFEANGFGPDGGYSKRWVKLKFPLVPIYFPNTKSRRRAVPLHDLHHIASGYDTSWTGEAEIAAWEIGGSCCDHYAAWLLNIGALTYGLLIAPRRVFRAFVRGRHSDNLYRGSFTDSLLDESVGSLRHRLALDAEQAHGNARDIGVFSLWAALAAVLVLMPLAVGVGLLAKLLL